MHPVAIVGIVVGGVALLWGGYEVSGYIFDWLSCRRERRDYEAFVRQYHADDEKKGLFSSPEDSDDDDDRPLSESSFLSSSYLRQRNQGIQDRGNSLMGMSHLEDSDEKVATAESTPMPLSDHSSTSSWASVHTSPHSSGQGESFDLLDSSSDDMPTRTNPWEG